MGVDDIFYDKTCDVYEVSKVVKDYTEVYEETIIYSQIPCDYYIATRGNVVNWQPDLWAREQDLVRKDLVIPWSVYDETKPIREGYYIKADEWDTYVIDQLDYYYLPDWTLECIYIRLNQKWNQL